jgi:hypothetical protein
MCLYTFTAVALFLLAPITAGLASASTITGLSLTKSTAGVQVTISGSGFGSAQGSGVVWLCGDYGVVESWSDTQVVASVASKAVSGVARVRQDGFWSNTVAVNLNNTAYRTVIPPGAAWMAGHQSRFGLTGGQVLRPNTGARSKMVGSVVQRFTEGDVRLTPDILNLEIGEARTIQALDEAGLPVTGLTWTSSNNNVVSLSSDDPPVLTALSAGEVTITAGTATAQVTVWPGALPVGTRIWSNSGGGSGILSVVPAVPSSTGVADVFAVWGDSTVSAITSDGATAWTASLLDAGLVVADFQGGLIISEYGGPVTTIAKLDGLTGQRSVLYTMNEPYFLAGIGVHTDGTIFVVQNSYTYLVRPSVIGIDPSGVQKFSVPIGGELGNGEDPPFITRGLAGGIMIAGDGYAYISYADQVADGNSGNVCNDHLWLLRIGTEGAVDNIPIRDWTDQCWEMWASASGSTITNGDTGTLFSWTYQTAVGEYVSGLALTAGAAATHIGAPPGQSGFAPFLQTQDGGFVGGGGDAEGNPTLVAIGASGSLKWSVSGQYQAQIATADNGVIATDVDGAAVVFDATGTVTGQMASLPVQSWAGMEYTTEAGSLSLILMPPIFADGASFWAHAGGNPSGNRTAYPECPCLVQSAGAAPIPASASHESQAVLRQANPRPTAPNDAPLKTYLILEGDAGLGEHNVGNLFHLAAETKQDLLNAQGNLAGSPQRVSSVQDFAGQLIGNGLITGGVMYFGHGQGVVYPDNTKTSVLSPGEQAGPDTNITADNVNLLSNSQLASGATVTLHACYAGLGSRRYSIAQLIANQLQRRVYAPRAGMFFSTDPNSSLSGKPAPALPNQKPIYQIQDFGKPLGQFSPW